MKNVIICGKRTDVPAFYYDWLQKVLAEKKIELINKYNQQKYTVDLNPEKTHSISLWSKNFTNVSYNISKSGVKSCTISFITFYKHVIERLRKSGIGYIEATPDIQKELASKFVNIAKENDIQIYSCANPILENVDGILKGHCVDGEILTKLFGEKASRAHASGQREACGCTKATDISSYSQKCGHGCRYCYLINTK